MRKKIFKNLAFLFLFILVIIVISSPFCFAESGHASLLAVSENSNGTYEGSIANLYLEIKPGTGHVFIDTFPITKLDTQMTTRFAKQMACKFLDRDCSMYDFFYTINANSPIIAGPSAGASTTLLTISVLQGIDFDKSIVITGTINSGYLIGNVGGLKEKVEAASENWFKKVLVPEGSMVYTENNKTINLSIVAQRKNITVLEVSDINEALFELSGKSFKKNHQNVSADNGYINVMKDISVALCNRTLVLEKSVDKSKLNESSVLYTTNLTKNSFSEFEKGNYYSAASMCFGANVEYLQNLIIQSNLSSLEYDKKVSEINSQIDDFIERVKLRDVKTLTDLEANIVVHERLIDAKYYADLVNETNTTSEKSRLLSYSIERLNTAHLWNEFYGLPGQKIKLDNEILAESCQMKISEAEERYQYARLYFPELLVEIRAEINRASDHYEKKEYSFCIFAATSAKSRADLIISSLSLEENKKDVLLNQKISAAKNSIAEEIEKGLFPILGYSYYEYANTLKKSDPLSALIYSEYALEFSNLDIYFGTYKSEAHDSGKNAFSFDYRLLFLFFFGIIIGYLIHAGIINAENKIHLKKKKEKNNKFIR